MTLALRSALVAALLLALLPLAWSQDETPAPDGASAGDSSGTGNSAALAALESNEPISFSGTLTTLAGGAIGWDENPLTAGFGGTATRAGFSMENILGFDARPAPEFRVHGSARVVQTDKLLAEIYESFLDYSFKNAVFFRGGLQTLSWGESRVFGVGNILTYPTATSGTPVSWVAIKAYMPFGADGLILAALAPRDADITSSMVMYAAKLDLAFGKIETETETLARASGEIDFSACGKTSLLGIDLHAQVFGHWNQDSGVSISSLESAYWEASSPRVKIYAEHWYNGASSVAADNRLALGLGWTPAGASCFKLGLLWAHAFADSSGTMMPTVVYELGSKIKLSLAGVATYGEAGSIYASALPPSYNSPISWSEKYSLILRVDIALDY
jgi:hypothetical protein